MATDFADLYPYIRTLLGDTNEEILTYSADVLKRQISLFSWGAGEAYEADDNAGVFTDTLTNTEKAIAVYTVARSIISPQPDEFAWKGPVMSVRRKGANRTFLKHLDDKIDELNGDTFHIASESEIEAFVNASTRLTDQQAEAQG